MSCRGLLAGLLTGCLALSSVARAQGEAEDGAEPAAPRALSLARRFGVEALVRRLNGASESERRRAIERLAGIGTPVALDRLASSVLARRDRLGAREWLTVARSLAAHTARPESVLVLATLMSQRAPQGAGPEEAELFGLARASAALALAAGGTDAGLEVLGRALRSAGPAAALAAEAVRAHPPRRLQALLEVPGQPTVELARVLGSLGDQRAFDRLRGWVRGESAEVRAASAIALTELGDLETVALARTWQGHELLPLRRAALRIAMLAHAPEASRELVRELRAAEVAPEWRQLALEFPAAELLDVASAGSSVGAEDSAWWCTLLGRIGGEAAARRLELAASEPGHAFAAIHALSRLPGPAGHMALEHLLRREVALGLSLRAAAARAALWGERFDALPGYLERRIHSDVAAERADAAWALSLRGGAAALAQLGSQDVARVLGAANNALLFDDAVLERAAAWLSEAAPGPLRTALSVALLRPAGQRGVTSTLLRELVIESGPAAPLALRVLSSREDPELSPIIATYRRHADPILRAHVARGLGDNVEPSATSLLVHSFEFETDESVRQAIVYALSTRSGEARKRTLTLAADLDSSEAVRSAARLALAGVRLGDPPAGSDLLWAELRTVGSVGEPAAENQAALLNVAPGLAFPVFVGGGWIVVAGVSADHLGIRLQ